MKKITSILLIFMLIITSFPSMIFAQGDNYVDLPISVKDEFGNYIHPSSKGVNHNSKIIDFSFDENFLPNEKAYANVVASGINETYKFDVSTRRGGMKLKLREDSNYEKIYSLRKQTHYTIYIPAGSFYNVNDEKIKNKEFRIDFVTDNDTGDYRKDILTKITPVQREQSVDRKTGKITFEFIEDIELSSEAKNKIGDYISIKTTPMNPYIPSYNQPPSYENSDSIDNFDVLIDKNKLILSSKSGTLKGYANYEVKLKNRTVFLKDSPEQKIYNDVGGNLAEWEVLNFRTDNMVISTFPKQNQEGVELEPKMYVDFEYPIDIEDIGKIYIQSNEENGDAKTLHISANGIYAKDNRLYIDIDDYENDGKHLLKENHLYSLIVKEKAIKFKNFGVFNHDIRVDFITRAGSNYPYPTTYSSNSNFSDDIRDLDKTKLDRKGNLYIKMNEKIRWDKLMDKNRKVILELMEYPTPNTINYDPLGVRYPGSFEYSSIANSGLIKSILDLQDLNKHYTPLPIKKEDLEIVNSDTIKVNLNSSFKGMTQGLNHYRIILDKELFENEESYNPKTNIDFEFWTSSTSTMGDISWDVSKNTAKDISVDNKAPYRTFILSGTPAYTPYTKGMDDKPIIFDINSDVIPNPKNQVFEEVIENDKKRVQIRNKGLEEIRLSDFNEKYSQINIDNNLGLQTYDVVQNQEINVKLSSSLQQEAGTLVWSTSDPSIATIDSNGKIKALKTGTATIKGYKNNETFVTFYLHVTPDIGIGHISLEYIQDENANKKTRIKIYPTKTLENGKKYDLEIPKGAFISRDSRELESLSVIFVVAGDMQEAKGIQEIINSTLSMETLYKEDPKVTLKGYNFSERIVEAILTPSDGSNYKVVIPKEDIRFINLNTLELTLKGDAKKLLISSGSRSYSVKVKFLNQLDADSGLKYITITQMGSPVVLSRNPDTNQRFDENSLTHPINDSITKGRYFIKVVFDDPDASLKFIDDDIRNSVGLDNLARTKILPSGSDVSMVDTEFIEKIRNSGDLNLKNYINKYLFVKENKKATLYVPVKLLRSQTEYYVEVYPNVVQNAVKANAGFNWKIATKETPYISDLFDGSLPEDYDDDDYVVIRGDFFTEDSQIYFNDEKARKVKYVEVKQADSSVVKYLHVYPPRDLEPGTYNVKVRNDSNHETLLEGKFSIIKSGEFIPNEDYTTKSDSYKGEVRADNRVSEDTIYLERRYSSDETVSLNLDDLMGNETYIRKINMSSRDNESIKYLKTESYYADINLYNVKVLNSREDAIIRLGRTKGSELGVMNSKLRGRDARSEFINVTGENYTVSGVELWIPFKSSAEAVMALRYDESTRNFYPVDYRVDFNSKKVNVISDKSGIFVIVAK